MPFKRNRRAANAFWSVDDSRVGDTSNVPRRASCEAFLTPALAEVWRLVFSPRGEK
jgi:hypothetical protein